MVNLYRSCPAGPPFNCPSGDDSTYVDTVDYDHPSDYVSDVFSAALHIEHEHETMTFTSISSVFQSDLFATGDFDLAALAPFIDNWGSRDRSWTGFAQELRASSNGGGGFNWLVGVFYQHREVDDDVIFRSYNMGTASYDVFPNLFSSTFEQMAVFGNATWALGPWVLEAGARVEHDEQNSRERGSGTTLDHSDEVVLPRVSATYHFNDDLMAYGSVTQGFQPGGVFSGNAGLTDYESESTTNYEIGLKGSAFGRRLSFEAVAFWISYDDRVYVEKTITPPAVDTRENIGSSENVGFELSGRFNVTQHLTFSAGIGVVDGEWGDDARYNSPTVGAVISVAGLTTPFTPEYQGNLAIDWERPIGYGLTLGLRADVVFVGEHFWEVENLRSQEAYQLVNFGARVEGEHWQLSARLENAFDEGYNSRFFYGPGLGAPYDLAMLGQPRLFTARLGLRF
jgi:iron complex outermembrane receptor protein